MSIDRVVECPSIRLSIVLGVAARVFPEEEVSMWTGRLRKVDFPPQDGWTSNHFTDGLITIKDYIRKKELFLLACLSSSWDTGPLLPLDSDVPGTYTEALLICRSLYSAWKYTRSFPVFLAFQLQILDFSANQFFIVKNPSLSVCPFMFPYMEKSE